MKLGGCAEADSHLASKKEVFCHGLHSWLESRTQSWVPSLAAKLAAEPAVQPAASWAYAWLLLASQVEENFCSRLNGRLRSVRTRSKKGLPKMEVLWPSGGSVLRAGSS